MTSLLYGEKYVAVDQQRSFGRCGGNHSAYYIVLLKGLHYFHCYHVDDTMIVVMVLIR